MSNQNILSNELDQAPKTWEFYQKEINKESLQEEIKKAFDGFTDEKVIKAYEKNVAVSYSKLEWAIDEKWWDKRWSALYKWERTSMYTDPNIIHDLYTSKIINDFPNKKIIKIADFGWGDGFMWNTIIKQLDEKWMTGICVNIDQSLSGTTGNQEVKWRFLQNREEMWALKRNTIGIWKNFVDEKINIKENSIDCAIMRYSLQYSGNELRRTMLQEIFRYIKPWGKLYCLWPWATSDEQAIAINKPRWEFWKITLWINPADFLKNKRLPSIQQVESDSLAAGFDVIKSWECEDFVSMYSLEWITNWSRFKKFTPEQKEKFKSFMQELQKEYPQFIETEEYYKNPNIFIVLEKRL